MRRCGRTCHDRTCTAGDPPEAPPSRGALLREPRERIRGARLRAALAVDHELATLYRSTGADILARQAVENGWSRDVLAHRIAGGLYGRRGRAPTNPARAPPAGRSEPAQRLVRDPCGFGLLALGPDMLERDLERGPIEHLRALVPELGKGFAFVGGQHRLEAGGRDFCLDLLFYHLRLRYLVAFDPRIEGFRPEFAGKTNSYLSAVDDHGRRRRRTLDGELGERHELDEPALVPPVHRGRPRPAPRDPGRRPRTRGPGRGLGAGVRREAPRGGAWAKRRRAA